MAAVKNIARGPVYKISQFTGIPASTLVHLVLTAHNDPVTQHRALHELARLSPQRRSSHLILALRQMVKEPHLYEQDVMFSIIELLATDPNPDATRAMIEVLPVVAAAQRKGTGPLTLNMREYFYQALATRQRETDRDIWREMVPQLDGETLVALLTDPTAAPLRRFINPMLLIEHLPDTQRKRALRNLMLEGNMSQGFDALKRLFKG